MSSTLTTLDAFLTQHEERLRELLADLWPLQVWKVQQYGNLTKYTLGQLPDGRWAHLHHIRAPDTGPPHDHPTEIETILFNPYLERRFIREGGGYRVEEVLHPAGATLLIKPEDIHQIPHLPDGEAWTVVKTGPVERVWRHYSWQELGILQAA